MNCDVDLIAEAGERLVDRVVDDFVDEVMQSATARSSPMYIAGRLRTASRAFENLDLVGMRDRQRRRSHRGLLFAGHGAGSVRVDLGSLVDPVGSVGMVQHQTRIGMIT